MHVISTIVIGYSVGWRKYETKSFRLIHTSQTCAAEGAGRAATGWRGPAVQRRVLLQGAMGPSGGVSATVPEEPLPAAGEDPGDGADSRAEDRDAGIPHDGGWAMGLSREHPVQRLDGGDDREPRR